MIYSFTTNVHKTLSDTHTPVELYLKLRDKFPNSFLLESSDYKSKENSFSYLCFQPIASFVVKKDKTSIHFPDGTNKEKSTSSIKIAEELYQFTNAFQSKDLKLGFVTNGLFGYTSYDAIPLFEDIQFKNQSFDLPLIQYHLFRFTIVFNHFNNELFILENLLKDEDSNLKEIKDLLVNRSVTTFHFKKTSDETSNFTDEAFLKKIAIGQAH